MKLSDLIERFRTAGMESPRANAEFLVCHVLGCARSALVGDQELPSMEALIERRLAREPLDYIIGQKDFFGCSLRVTSDVLIPRPETEYMVELIARTDWSGARILDLCCGSGAIAAALQKRFPTARVEASDICPKAVAIARANGVDAVQRDFLNGVQDRFDLDVCNPPYVTQEEWENLGAEVRDFEPKKALVADREGMVFYEKLAASCPGDRLWLEYTPLRPVRPLFSRGRVHLDLSGRERFLEIDFLEKVPLQ